jgi:AAA family ATP:ADP antiporter
MTSLLVEDIGFQNLFPIAAGVLLVAVICIFRLREFVENDQTGAVAKQAAIEKPLGGNPFAGITHIAGSRYFLGIAFTSVIASLLGTALYMFMAQLVEVEITAPDAAKQAAMRTAFFSDINNWTNALSLLGQMLIVKHVVERFGIGASLTLLPIASIAGFGPATKRRPCSRNCERRARCAGRAVALFSRLFSTSWLTSEYHMGFIPSPEHRHRRASVQSRASGPA